MSPDKPTTSTPTTAKESRRTSKPLMEKKRRARINECLSQLKTLVLEAMKKDSSRHSKLEKADILEMTVRHLRSLHRQYVAMAIAADPNVVNKYKAGFSECTSEVTKFLSSAEGIDSNTRSNILNHLSGCLQNVGSSSAITNIGACSSSAGTTSQVPIQPMQVQIPTFATIPIGPMPSTALSPSVSPSTEATNNTNTASGTVVVPQGIQQLANMYSGLRFLPGTGEIALVFPNQGHLSNQIPVIPVYANALTSTSQTAATSTGSTSTLTASSAAAGSSTSTASSDVTLASKIKTPCECTTGKPTVIVTPSTSSISNDAPSTKKTMQTAVKPLIVQPFSSSLNSSPKKILPLPKPASASIASSSFALQPYKMEPPVKAEQARAPSPVDAQYNATESMWRPW